MTAGLRILVMKSILFAVYISISSINELMLAPEQAGSIGGFPHTHPIKAVIPAGRNAATFLIINFNCTDIAKEVRRPGNTQLISIQWINAERRLSEAYCNSIKRAITRPKK